jgi:hypothetical protein
MNETGSTLLAYFYAGFAIFYMHFCNGVPPFLVTQNILLNTEMLLSLPTRQRPPRERLRSNAVVFTNQHSPPEMVCHWSGNGVHLRKRSLSASI